MNDSQINQIQFIDGFNNISKLKTITNVSQYNKDQKIMKALTMETVTQPAIYKL